MTEQTPRRPRRRPTSVSLLLFGVIALGVWWFGGQDGSQTTQPVATTVESSAGNGQTPVAPEQATAVATPIATDSANAEPTVESPPTVAPTTAPPATAIPATGPRAPPGMPIFTFDDLPPEAVETIELIETGGPFPYSKDGSVFQNREGFLPDEARGYYREYTVTTLGASNRGARRIVAGDDGEIYYTSDHYASFSWVVWE